MTGTQLHDYRPTQDGKVASATLNGRPVIVIDFEVYERNNATDRIERDRLREINAELLVALKPLLDGWKAFKDSYGNQEDAYYKLAKGKHASWERLSEISARAEGEDR